MDFVSYRIIVWKFIFSFIFLIFFSVIGKTQDNNQLSDLTVNYGELSPAFNTDITSYTLIVPDNILLKEINFTAVFINAETGKEKKNTFLGSSWIWVNRNEDKVKIEVYSFMKLVMTYYVFIERLPPNFCISDSFKLKNVFIGDRGTKRPKWMDKNGYVYATSGDSIYRSINKGLDWQLIHVVPDSLKGGSTGSFSRATLIVADNNRIIYCSKGKVVVSDEMQKIFSVKYNFISESIARSHLGCSAQDSIILLGTYETYSDIAEVILSTNYGATWKRIFFMKKVDSEQEFHIHDVRYDPFSKAILIATGDGNNCQIYFSKDWGKSWGKIFKDTHMARVCQTSQILCFPHGLVLGSDGVWDGLMYIPRNNEKTVLDDEKVYISGRYIAIDTAKTLKRFAVRQWNSQKSNRSYCLLPWYHCIFPNQNAPSDYSRLWLSYNGIEWYELYKWTTLNGQLFGFNNILGPDPADSGNTIFSNFHGENYFKAQIQFPAHLQRVKLGFPKNGYELNEPVFKWSKIHFAYDYRLQISLRKDFSTIVVEDSMLVGVNYYCDKLSANTKYYWRIKAVGIDGEGAWSEVSEFIVRPQNIYLYFLVFVSIFFLIIIGYYIYHRIYKRTSLVKQ